MKQKLKALIEILIIILIFIIISYIVQTNIQFFEKLIGNNIYGILFYLIAIIIAMVVAPISSIPLIPIMSNVWGWQLTGIISIIGWTIGAVLVFILCRRFGVDIIKKLIPLNDMYAIENKIPKENLFWVVLFLRMVIPADILSYALGLFSKIKFWPYTIATFFGIIPAAFLLAYIGLVKPIIQAIIFIIVAIIFIIGWMINEKRNKH